MDVFSHTLWGYGLFGHRGRPGLAALFGALPDVLAFAPFTIIQIFNGEYTPGPPSLDVLPYWTFLTYDFTHSFVSVAIVFGLCFSFRKDILFPLLSWPFHILLDFPFHTKEYFPAHIFWPISNFYVDGISWGNPWVWYPNLAGVLIVLGWRFKNKKKVKIQL
ncbi:MAG: hypothetical protein ACE5IH_05065 [Thermodesulfobacteriota bacterium]